MIASDRQVILFSCRPDPESANIRVMDQQLLSDNIAKLLQRVSRSAQKSQYHNSDILVVAVSKTRPAQDIRAAFAHGLIHFGESYLQEALRKMAELEDLQNMEGRGVVIVLSRRESEYRSSRKR